jgi:hypothetical protein
MISCQKTTLNYPSLVDEEEVDTRVEENGVAAKKPSFLSLSMSLYLYLSFIDLHKIGRANSNSHGINPNV